MATKYITRTITEYSYTFGKFDVATMTVTDIRTCYFGYKLGAREEKKLEKQYGSPIISREQRETLFGITMEDFLLWAKPMGDDGKPIGKSRAEREMERMKEEKELPELSE